MSTQQKPTSLEAVIDRFEGSVAILRFPDQQELRIPSKLVPKLKEGSVLRLSLGHAPESEKEREALARSMLNHLLTE